MKEKIEKLLDIETLDRNLFRGQGEGGEVASRVFGGHVIAQALAAAYKTVEERLCHSLHAYFIRPGDPSHPLFTRLTEHEMVEASQREEWLLYKMANKYSIWLRHFILKKRVGLISIK